jgi:protein ImuB
MPREVKVMVRPSEDRDGAPVAFQYDGRSHRIVYAVGPERIAGAWWTGHDKTRDYFDVEDESGGRWWVFRVLETFKWYVHGTFQ